MMVISFILCVGAAIAKVSESKLLGGLNFEYCLQLLMATMTVYLGRKFQSGDTTIEQQEK